MSLVVVEVVQALLVEEAGRPAGGGGVEQGGLAPEDGLPERRFGSRPSDDLPAVDLLQANLEASPSILVDERSGDNRGTIIGLERRRYIQWRKKRREPP